MTPRSLRTSDGEMSATPTDIDDPLDATDGGGVVEETAPTAWLVTFGDGSGQLEHTETEANHAIARADPGAIKQPLFLMAPDPKPPAPSVAAMVKELRIGLQWGPDADSDGQRALRSRWYDENFHGWFPKEDVEGTYEDDWKPGEDWYRRILLRVLSVDRPSPSVGREEIARIIWNQRCARMGGSFEGAKGTVAREQCEANADEILSCLARPATAPSPPSTAGTEEG